MKNAAVLCFLVVVTAQQQSSDETKNIIDQIFTSPRTDDFLPGYEEVTKSTGGSLGALEKCGQGSDEGVHLCVPYYQCDGRTNLIVRDGRTDGFGVIDIRLGANSCPHPLDVCCGLPTVREPGDMTTPRPTPASSSQPPVEDQLTACGVRNPNGIDFKITGNKDNEAEYGEFPWMVAILKKERKGDENIAVCGGSLIAPNVVLTGAHCVYNFKTHELKIRAGEWDTQTTKERLPYQESDISQIIVHEEFNAKTVFNDVALLLLALPVTEAENIGTVCLPNQNQRILSRNCFASGWGKDVFGKQGRFQVILKKIELPLVERPDCERALRTTRLGAFFNLHDSFVCAGGERGKDTCTGDGGSPLVCPDPLNPGRYLQTGIVSWGIGCGEDGIPGVYADLSKFRNWVDSQLQRLNVPSDSYVK